MAGEKNLEVILKTLRPVCNSGEFVFVNISDLSCINIEDAILIFKEAEGYTTIIEKRIADTLQLPYSFVASWITLTVHSSLQAVGLTAAFSKALADEGISCNVVAAYYHDHIFVDQKDAAKAMSVLNKLSNFTN